MKFQIQIDPNIDEDEVIVKVKKMDAKIQRIQGFISSLDEKPLIFYKGTSEYFLDLKDFLFFETESSKVWAHTREETFEVKLKLYELEAELPYEFCRISKSTIVNCRQIFSLDRSFSGTSTVSFQKSPKVTHVSRRYYHSLKERLEETR